MPLGMAITEGRPLPSMYCQVKVWGALPCRNPAVAMRPSSPVADAYGVLRCAAPRVDVACAAPEGVFFSVMRWVWLPTRRLSVSSSP